MNPIYQYSILKYIHSQFLGEEVNIGIIFYFPEDGELIFKFPSQFDRLKHLYKDFPEKTLKSYLRNFEKAANRSSKERGLFIENTLDKILPKYLIVPDSSSLVFEDINSGVKYSNSYTIADDIFKKYFAHYFSGNIQPEVRRDEKYIIHHLHKSLKIKDENTLHYLRGERKLSTPKALLKADEYWKNHTDNIVKAVGFDLKDESQILHKAAYIYGTLNFITEDERYSDYRFDLITTAPKDSKLLPVYKNALGIISESKAKKEIITEKTFENYIDKIITEVERIDLGADDRYSENLPF